jgi:hypothetical protein
VALALDPTDKVVAAELEKVDRSLVGTIGAAPACLLAGVTTTAASSRTTAKAAEAAPASRAALGADDSRPRAVAAASSLTSEGEEEAEADAMIARALRRSGRVFDDCRSDRPPPPPLLSEGCEAEQKVVERVVGAISGPSASGAGRALDYGRFDRIADADEDDEKTLAAAAAGGSKAQVKLASPTESALEARKAEAMAVAMNARAKAAAAAQAEADDEDFSSGYKKRPDGSKVCGSAATGSPRPNGTQARRPDDIHGRTTITATTALLKHTASMISMGTEFVEQGACVGRSLGARCAAATDRRRAVERRRGDVV